MLIDNELLSSSADDNLESLLKEYGDVVPSDLPQGLSPTCKVQHGIDVMEGKKAVRKLPYCINTSESQEVERHLVGFLARGFIRSSLAPGATPILLVRKKDGFMQLCIDYLGKIVIVFLDDILMFSTTEEENIEHLRQMFEKLRAHALRLRRASVLFPRMRSCDL